MRKPLNFASITEFVAGLDSDSVLADVRDKVNIAKAKLPSVQKSLLLNNLFANIHSVVTAVLWVIYQNKLGFELHDNGRIF